MKEYFLFFLLVINTVSAIICTADKIKAIKHKRRISEKTLWSLSFCGGSVFMYLTMILIRHKTLHKSFMTGLPILIIFQMFLVLLLTKLYQGHIMA